MLRNIVLITILIVILAIGFIVFNPEPKKQQAETSSLVLVQGNSLMAISSPTKVGYQVLGAIIGEREIDSEEERRVVEQYPDLYWASKYESNFDPKVCNNEIGCKGGMGMVGFIASTWNSTLDRMMCRDKYDTENCLISYLPKICDKKIYHPMSEERIEPVFNAECNLIAGQWLYSNDGTDHWGTEDTKWGSYKHWAKYVRTNY